MPKETLVRIRFVVLAVAVALAAGMGFARADGSGGHNFSSTLAAQDANVAKYRRAVARRP